MDDKPTAIDSPPAEVITPTATRQSALKRWGVFIALLLFAYAIARAWIGHEGRLVGQDHPAVGHPLIFASLRSLSDPEKVLGLSDLTGKVTLLNFWGTWCPPCRTELPQLAALADRYRNESEFELLAVTCEPPGYDQDTGDLVSETKAFLKQAQIDLPVYLDPDAQTRAALDVTIGFEGFPTTLIVDRQGVIRGAWVGYRRGYETEMNGLISDLLKSNPQPSTASVPAT